jgi:hypothetical protein
LAHTWPIMHVILFPFNLFLAIPIIVTVSYTRDTPCPRIIYAPNWWPMAMPWQCWHTSPVVTLFTSNFGYGPNLKAIFCLLLWNRLGGYSFLYPGGYYNTNKMTHPFLELWKPRIIYAPNWWPMAMPWQCWHTSPVVTLFTKFFAIFASSITDETFTAR